jgi:hypothetical protein
MNYREHPSYKNNKDLLKFYLDSYLGGDSYVVSRHLHQFGREVDEAYIKRLSRAYYLNYVFTVVRIYTQYVCGNVARVTDGDWKEVFENKFYPNVTGDGVDLHSFFREVCDKASVFGYQGVLVDGTKVIKNRPAIPTAATDLQYPPVLRKVDATDIIDWSMDSQGNLNWVLIKTTLIEDSDPMKPRKSYRGLELWKRDGVVYYKEKKESENVFQHDFQISEDEKDTYTQTDSVEYNYNGRVPFVLVRNSRTLLDGIPASMIKDIAMINKAIFNYTSLRDEILYKQTFSILALPTMEGDEDSDYEKIIGMNNYLGFDGNSNHIPTYLTVPSGPAETLTNVIRGCIEEIFRLAVLEKTGNDKNSEYSTAYGRMVDSQDTESALAEKAELMESAEYEVATMYNRVRGDRSGKPYWKPQYPEGFDVKQLTQDLADAIQEDTLGMGEAYMVARKKKIARKAFPELESKEMEEIDKGIVEATKLMEGAKEKELNDPSVSGGINNAVDNHQPGGNGRVGATDQRASTKA